MGDLTQAEAYKEANLANGFWSQLENAKLGNAIRFFSAASVESALQWKHGSVERLLSEDADPTPLEEEPSLLYLRKLQEVECAA